MRMTMASSGFSPMISTTRPEARNAAATLSTGRRITSAQRGSSDGALTVGHPRLDREGRGSRRLLRDAGHQEAEFLLSRLARGAFAGNPAAAHHEDTVRQGHDLLQLDRH